MKDSSYEKTDAMGPCAMLKIGEIFSQSHLWKSLVFGRKTPKIVWPAGANGRERFGYPGYPSKFLNRTIWSDLERFARGF